MPEKYVRIMKDTYEDARTQVKRVSGIWQKIEWDCIKDVFDMILYMYTGPGMRELPPLHGV